MKRFAVSLCLGLLLTFDGGHAARAQDLVPRRHGVAQRKGDAGFWYMAAEGGFAKQ